ncbi:MAG: DNA repair protein RecN [Bacteroidetes Order II. Incertae sedis bacterium]|nr:DNA repair protein RecN [Bacteroidetes Order II. bacterium]
MLRSLSIRDYTLIDRLEITFENGLNIITGETGAGKSILVGALKLILGERASTDVIRSGAHKAVLEGVFDAPHAPKIREVLFDHGYEYDDTLILRREIGSSSSRGFINDSPATMQLMRQVAESVIDLHGQHEHQSLLRTETHIEVLDNYAGLGELRAEYQMIYREMEGAVKARRQLIAREKDLKQKQELYAYQIKEIDEVSPKPGEEATLEAEAKLLENAEKRFAGSGDLVQMLYESEEAVYDRLVRARSVFAELATIDQRLQEPLADLRSAEVLIAELTKFLQDYHARVAFDPERLLEIRNRLGEFLNLKRKYGETIEEVIAFREKIGAQFELAADFEGAIARADKQVIELAQRLAQTALRLSAKRKEAALHIEEAIVRELRELGIVHAAFQVQFGVQADAKGWIRDQTTGKRFAALPNGVDEVAFYISTNLGETPRPLAKTASGGEISRIMLALKTILAKNERLPILVFDEIDTGISGRIAGKVGEAMRSLGEYHQIIAITHLPQIAAQGHSHYVVEKLVAGERTRSQIRLLSVEDRIRTIAAMFSGDEITEAALESARALLKQV